LNILNIPTIKEINTALDLISKDKKIFILVFTGSGEKAFSAGVDIRDHTPGQIKPMLTHFHSIFRKLTKGNWVTLAVVNGVALGGGCELATFCDFVFASEHAKFGQPEIDVGCFPPIAAAEFPKMMTKQMVSDLLLMGETITAHQAKEIGLVNRIVPAGNLMHSVQNHIDLLKKKSPAVLGLTKKAIAKGNPDFLRALEQIEKIYLTQLSKTKDMAEGIQAFIEKRPPKWSS
jgi:cyclohexa-1,5-dienecarbonyl-CoA hydratase